MITEYWKYCTLHIKSTGNTLSVLPPISKGCIFVFYYQKINNNFLQKIKDLCLNNGTIAITHANAKWNCNFKFRSSSRLPWIVQLSSQVVHIHTKTFSSCKRTQLLVYTQVLFFTWQHMMETQRTHALGLRSLWCIHALK